MGGAAAQFRAAFGGSSKSLDRHVSLDFSNIQKSHDKTVNLSNVGLMHRKTAPISGAIGTAIFLVQKVGKNG